MNKVVKYFYEQKQSLVPIAFRDYLTVSLIGLLRENPRSPIHSITEPFVKENLFSEEMDYLLSMHSRYRALLSLFEKAYRPTYSAKSILAFIKLYETLQIKTGNSIYRDELFSILQEGNKGQINSSTRNLQKILNISLDEVALLISRGYSNLCSYYGGLISNTFWFELYGPNKINKKPLCETIGKKVLHINEIISMKNEQIEPVYIFCGGYGCYHTWQPNPFYKQSA